MRARRNRRSALLILMVMVIGTIAPATAASAGHAVLTTAGPYITLDSGVPTGSSVLPIITVGEDGGVAGFEFEGLPDGIGIVPGEGTLVDVYVAHEQTTVPFRNERDFQDGSVSRLTLETAGTERGAVVDASVAISPDNGYLRFCSASVAGPAEGFSRHIFFTGEESNDVVDVPTGAPYGSDPALAPQRQAGYAVALDTETGEHAAVPGMGRLNHENTIAVPGGWNQHALLTTDDTFSGPSAQLYLYLANHEDHIFEDKGSLWAFRVTHDDEGAVQRNDPFNGSNDYLDISPGDEFRGEFIRVPKQIARGETDVAPQQALEDWSNENNVFQFIRLEDLAYDVNEPRVVYVADTGRSRVVPDPETGRLTRGPGGTQGFADNGSIFRFEFNEENPRKVDSFSVLAQGDAPGSDAYVPFVSPDNIDTSSNSLMVQEDADNARIWQHHLGTGTWSVIASVNDADGESSGIVDASNWFGPGSWLLDVQAHSTNVREEVVDGVTLKQEDGQLMLMTIPGS